MRFFGSAARVAGVLLAGGVVAGLATFSAATAYAIGSTASTIALTVSPTGTTVSDQPVTFTVTVGPLVLGGPTPTGNVVFATSSGPRTDCNGGPATVALVGGVASCTVSSLSSSASPVTVQASYLGDVTYATSTTNLSETVTPADTTTSVTAKLIVMGGIGSGKPNNFVATLAPVSPSTGTPTGDVIFNLTGTGGATAECSNGSTGVPLNRFETAKCQVPAGVLVAGSSPWTITASYSGDASFAASSGNYAQTVHATVTTTHLSSNPNPPSVSEPLTVTSSVTVPKFAVEPTGTITFTFAMLVGPPAGSLPNTPPTSVMPLPITCDGGSNTISLVAGTNYATCTLPAGVEPLHAKFGIMASYSGDANNGTSSSLGPHNANWRRVQIH